MMQELRFALRRLGGSPGFVAATVSVLALGLGANIVLFNVAYALFWRPLNFFQPDRLATIDVRSATGRLQSGTTITATQAGFLADRCPAIQEVGLAATSPRIAISQGNDTFDLEAASVNAGYFRALGLSPIAGRLLSDDDDHGGSKELKGILLESAWRTYFGGDPTVVGSTLPANFGTERTLIRVVGVLRMPATLPFVPQAEILLPIAWRSQEMRANYGNAFYRAVVRLRTAATVQRASQEVRAAFDECDRSSPYPRRSQDRYSMKTLRLALQPANPAATLLLCGAAGLLLVIMCANLASLLLARAMSRSEDSALRLALGASWVDLLRHNMVESLLLCLTGTVLAFGLNQLARRTVLKLAPQITRLGPELLAAGPMLVVFGIVLATVVAFAIALPASLHSLKAGPGTALSRAGGRVAGGGRGLLVLVGAQLAIVLTLLTISGLVGRSLLAALRSDAGMDPNGVATFRVSLMAPRSATVVAAAGLARQIESVAGVRSAAFAADLPIGSSMSCTMSVHGGPFVPSDPDIGFRMVSARYFDALHARLLSGRALTEDEVQRGGSSMVLNQTAARALFGAADPLGRNVHIALGSLDFTVVGIVNDIRHEALDRPSGPVVYFPYHAWFPGSVVFLARTGESSVLRSALKERLSAWSGGAFARGFSNLEDVAGATVRDRLSSTTVIGGFALLGLVISLLGLYGTLSMQVQRRRREIGVRVALGASPGSILGLVVGQGTRILCGGLAIGLAASIGAGYAIRHVLYHVDALDATSILWAVGLLSAASMCACLAPALAALRVDPAAALRAE